MIYKTLFRTETEAKEFCEKYDKEHQGPGYRNAEISGCYPTLMYDYCIKNNVAPAFYCVRYIA